MYRNVSLVFWDVMPYNLLYRQQVPPLSGTRVCDTRKAGYRFGERRIVSELVTHMSANNFERGRGKHFLMKKGGENFRTVCVSLFLLVIFSP